MYRIFLDIHTHKKGIPGSIYNKPPEGAIPLQSFSWGIHPWDLDQGWEKELDKIEMQMKLENLLAIGECGFDLIKGPVPSLQKEAFLAQTKLAEQYGLPVILHCVKGFHLIQEYFKKNEPTPAIIWHGYNQKTEIAKSLISYPIYFSFGKALLDGDSNAQKWLKICPLERIFFETDDAEIEIFSIYEQASLILQLPIDNLAKQVSQNWNSISKRKIT
ncbi:TatD family hydrolase [Shivajiella indica]|uniref:TatD family hydrolase n=1 Tax=Shivajiella indica TaxID=872115 RepID=A0ABW5B9V5_9BACT